MHAALKARIAALADTDLIRLLTVDVAQYRQDAIEFALLEARRRNLTVDPRVLPATQPRPDFVASLRMFVRRLPRAIVLSACLGLLPFAIAALLHFFKPGHSADTLLLAASAPGLLLNGLLTGNIDSAFDTPSQIVATVVASWLVWALAFHLARSLVAAVRRT